MKWTLPLALAAILTATGCTDPDPVESSTPLEEALGVFAAPDGATPIGFVDAAGIRGTLGYDPVIMNDALADHQDADADLRTRWGSVVPAMALQPFSPDGSDPLFPTTDVEWVAYGASSVIAEAPADSQCHPRRPHRTGPAARWRPGNPGPRREHRWA